MTKIPNMALRHVGMYVTNMDRMVDFYQGLLGFSVSDRGPYGTGEIAFLTRDPNEHHEIVLATGRPPGSFCTVNQISFRAEAISDIRATYDLLVAAAVEKIDPIDHGNALSVYFWDPEGNRLEVYMATPWYVEQPNRNFLDFSMSDVEILAANEQTCRADPSFRPLSDWQADFTKRKGVV